MTTTPQELLDAVTEKIAISDNAYDPSLYLLRAQVYLDLDYPDLASGDAYRAVLLTDYVRDYSDEGDLELESGNNSDADGGEDSREEEEEDGEDGGEEAERKDAEEFLAATHALAHISAAAASSQTTPSELLGKLEETSLLLLARALFATGCSKESSDYCRQGQRCFPDSTEFSKLLETIEAAPPSTGGRSRRFVYPWNHHEPDRLSPETVKHLNEKIVPQASDNVEVKVVQLPLLSENAEVLGTTTHLGVFAKRDIKVGEICLREESALTVVTDPLDGGLCEYCGERWGRVTSRLTPAIKLHVDEDEGGDEWEHGDSVETEIKPFTCNLCLEAESDGDEVVSPIWCSKHCRDSAMEKYHPALCCRPIAPLHRAAHTPPSTFVYSKGHNRTALTTGSQPGGAVYSLLMMKAFAMALCQGTHPLDLEEVKYLYGVPPIEEGDLRIGWGWEENVRGVIGILEALGIDVFDGQWRPRDPEFASRVEGKPKPEWWNTWVVNTLIAKFRGVASGRLDERGCTEAAAAHTLYSLVNHDCEPDVVWKCSGIMEFKAIGEGELSMVKGEELKSCYCDRELGYKERREWMMGCLGGCCMCERCLREEREDREKQLGN